jgi:hypothetical protein
MSNKQNQKQEKLERKQHLSDSFRRLDCTCLHPFLLPDLSFMAQTQAFGLGALVKRKIPKAARTGYF